MAIGDDFEVQADGDIRHVSGTANYTVIEFHRWLQDLADDAVASGDDLLDITGETPSDRSTDNIITLNDFSGSGGITYNIDDATAEHLYDGSISQNGGDTLYSGLVILAPAGTYVQVVQANALVTNFWTTAYNADSGAGISHRFMVKSRQNGADIDGGRIRIQTREWGNTYAEFPVTLGLGNSVGALSTGTDLNNSNTSGNVALWTATDTEGYQLIDIDGDSSTEPYYVQWDWSTTGGNGTDNGAANNLYEYMKYVQRRGTAETAFGLNGELYRGVTHDITYDTQTGTFGEGNDVAWGTHATYDTELSSGLTVGEYYNFSPSGAVAKLLSLDDDGSTGHTVWQVDTTVGIAIANGDNFTRADGTLHDGGSIDAAPTASSVAGGKGRILASDDTSRLWIQLTEGVAPGDNDRLYESVAGVHNVASNFADVNVTVTSRTIPAVAIGSSTGSALIGAYGVAVIPADTTASDQFFDLDNTNRVPPNNVTFTVGGLVSGEDYVLVGPESGGSLQVDQFGLNATLNTDNITSVVIDTTIPTDTPASGTIRVLDDAGVYRRLEYSSYTGSTFTITTIDGNEDFATTNATAANNVFISYIDELATGATASFTSVYLASRSLFIRVRDGGVTPIKTFETTGTLGSGGGSTTAIRTTDL